MALFVMVIALGPSGASGAYVNNTAGLDAPQTRTSEQKTPRKVISKRLGLRWYIFGSPDGDFTITFPEKPTLKQVEQGPVTLIRSYETTTADGTTFSVNFQDIGGDPNARESNEWNRNSEETLAAADRAQNTRVIQTHRLARNIIESELLLNSPINGAELNSLRRSIIRRARIYTLGCGSVIDKKPVDKHACEKFFNSMRFVTKQESHKAHSAFSCS